MSIADTSLAILSEAVNFKVLHCQTNVQSFNSSTTHKHRHRVEKTELPVVTPSSKSTKSDLLRDFENSRSDSGKSSSGSPILLDCSFDSGIAGVLLDSNDMQLHKRIQQCQCILFALERDREYFFTIRNRLSKITDRKNNKSSESEFICNVCCAEIDPGDEKTYVKCYICQKYICRSIKCADWLPTTAEWECELCQTSKESLAQTSSWVAEQITFNQEKLICPPRARSEIYIPISECNDSSIHFESVSQIGANSFTITAEQKLKIREYVEEVVAKLVGGNLDTIGVNQLSKSENYLARDSKANNSHNGASRESGSIGGNCNDLTDISEIRLRQMIQKIIAETMNLPPLSNGHAVSEIALDRRSKINDSRPLTNDGFYQRHRTEHYFEPTIYQDLLATAVLNKIVDKQLNNNQAVSETNIVDRDGDSDDINDNVRLLGSNPNFNIEQSSTTSGSSVEPRSDFSYPEMEQILNTNDDKSSELLRNSDRDSVMSDYLASHMIPLPDLNAMATESDEDDYISVTSSAVGESTWEKNWLFKKKKSTLSGSVTANSMGMLVPDPKEDVRAQIGDKTADEVSDLSELSSDTDDSLNSLRSKLDPLNDRLVNKHLIGGQNSKMVLDELIERSSIMSNTLPGNEEPSYTDACNEHVIDAPIRNEAINNNVNQNPSTNDEKGDDPKAVASSVVVEDPSSITLSGSIAEREYKKWNNAVEMPNNPYAPEALKRRISGSQERFIDLPNISPTKDLNPLDLLNEQNLDADENIKRESDYKRYSRDYYINSSLTTPQLSPARDVSTLENKDNREVNNNFNKNKNNSYQKKSRNNANTKHLSNDCHWTLSTPVRRTSSLKYLNKSIISPPPSHQHASTYHQHNRSSSFLQNRPSTSTSNYNHFNKLKNDDAVDDEDNLDTNSQRSWKNNLAHSSKRRTVSMLSLFSADSSRSGNMSRNNHTDANVLTQFEKQLLHKDLKRNSFRAISSTTKDFVLNPLYEKDQFFNGDKTLKLSTVMPLTSSQESHQHEEHGDSGVDSCLYFPNDSKQNDNLLF